MLELVAVVDDVEPDDTVDDPVSETVRMEVVLVQSIQPDSWFNKRASGTVNVSE